MQKILIASDHAGFALKNHLINEKKDLEFEDLGTDSQASVDYPDFAQKLIRSLEPNQMGILICATGIGMSIAANRFPQMRAALCRSCHDAEMARKHNDANILILGSKETKFEEAEKILEIFLTTEFEQGRHLRRIQKLDA